MSNINRIAWGLVFILGAAFFLWLEVQGDGLSTMGWFLLTSLWSAICGIGYSVVQWLIES